MLPLFMIYEHTCSRTAFRLLDTNGHPYGQVLQFRRAGT